MRSKRYKNNKNRLHKKQTESHTASTGKGNYGRLQAPGGQRGQRAIPPDGFTAFSLGQHCRERQDINGIPLSYRTSPFSRGTFVCTYKCWRKQRAIPPDGFTAFSPGQRCRERQGINGIPLSYRTFPFSRITGRCGHRPLRNFPFQGGLGRTMFAPTVLR